MNEQIRKALELAKEALQRGSVIKDTQAIAAIGAALSAPAAPVARHIGDTKFEGWLSCHEPDRSHNRAPRYSKQDMLAAYWAGYSEAPAAPAAPVTTVRCAPERDAEDELHCAEGVLDALASQPAGLVEAAAQKLCELFDYPWEHMAEQGREAMRANARAILALRPAPAAPVAQGEREALREAQREAVMPLIGPLLDAWEGSSQTCREEFPELDKWLRRLNRAMEDAPAPAAPVSDEEIDALIADYRGRLYPQDMHPRFERALCCAVLALRPASVQPLTDEHASTLWRKHLQVSETDGHSIHGGVELIRAIERAHGIGQGGA